MRSPTFKRFAKIIALPALAMAGILMGGCQSGPANPVMAAPASAPVMASRPVVQRVTIDNFTFAPQSLTVAAGTTVTWVNHDDVPHTVTANDKRFRSKALDTDDQFSHLFTARGTYAYFCAVHPHMTGQIIVK